MLISIAMMFLVGMSMGWICKKIHLPSLFGMIVTGIVLGPYVLDVIDASILNISSDLRRIALIIILMRAGLSLDLNDLKKVGRPAVLMCFVPACFEIGGMILLAPKLLGISILDAAIMGTVIAAVSPAVIVPKMLKLMEEGYGVKKSIPQMILAGASVDDVFVIVMFTAFTGLAQGDQVSAVDFINIPISIAVGALAGFLIGFLSAEYFKKIHIRDTSKVIILVCVSFLLVTFEDEFASVIPFASLIAVMTMGIALQQKRKNVAKRLSAKFNKLWVGAEVMLFVLVGATVDIRYAVSAGVVSIVLIFVVLVFRMLGVFLCLLKTKLAKHLRVSETDARVGYLHTFLARWKVFKVDEKSIQKIIKAICSQRYQDEPELFDAKVTIRELFSADEMERKCILKTYSWDDFCYNIKHVNRFHSQQVNFRELKNLLDNMLVDIPAGSLTLYRSRICDEESYLKGYSNKKMGVPPVPLTTAGRTNSEGIQCLYLASDEETTFHEVRARDNDHVSVGEFCQIKDLKIVDLSLFDKIGPFSIPDFDMTWFAINIDIIRKIGNEVAMPMRRFDRALDYVPTQYICDYVKHLGYDGIRYKSTLVEGGINYAIFDEKKFDCVGVKVVHIGNIHYEWKEL